MLSMWSFGFFEFGLGFEGVCMEIIRKRMRMEMGFRT